MSDIPHPLKTALHPAHLALGARMMEFGGWDMPVQYAGILPEHEAVRTTSGMFDISHMGQIFVGGAASLDWLESLFTNRAARLTPGFGQYTLMLNPDGGVIDDLFLFRLGAAQWFLVVNASKAAEDEAWLRTHMVPDIQLTAPGAERAAIAVQGRQAAEVVEQLLSLKLPPHNGIAHLPEQDTYIARTGYTGEDGCEIFCPAKDAVPLWERLLAAGVKPCGLGARDTLRLEKCYPLNGSDLSPQRTPLEAGLGIFTDLSKPAFVGQDRLIHQKIAGVPSLLRAFEMQGKTPPPRAHYPVLASGEVVGEVSSGTLSPSLGTGIGMAYLPPSLKPGDPVEIDIRGKRFPAILRKKPLYPQS